MDYPADRLEGLHTALMGFAAAFLGRQDCIHVARADMTAVCVDTDQVQLDRMRPLYPAGWDYACTDIFDYAPRRYAEGATWDLVSLDPFTNQFAEVADKAGLWCALARRLVVIGTGPGTPVVPADGWRETDRILRSSRRGGVFWAVLEPA